MVVPIDLAVSEDVFDDVMEMLISDEIVVIEDIDMFSVKNLKDRHLSIVEDMDSSCCLSVYSYFAWELYINIDPSDIGLVNECYIWLIETKMLHIKYFLGLHWFLF